MNLNFKKIFLCSFLIIFKLTLSDQNLKENLANKLFELGAIKFGNFTLKSGIKSPIYIDLRVAISDPDALKLLAESIYQKVKNEKIDLVCGVPYAAVPFATTFSLIQKIPLIMPRKEAKNYGTKNNIEGIFSHGQKCLLIEDIITSGESIYETIKTLEDSNLKIAKIVVIIDRQQGGKEILEKKGYKIEPIFTLNEFLLFLLQSKKINEHIMEKIESNFNYNSNKISHKKFLTNMQRAEKCSNPVAYRLFKLIDEKKSNLAVAVDVDSKQELLKIADLLGPEICILKTHIDMIQDFDNELSNKLREIASKHNFLILEDRKFADIGTIAKNQLTGGIYKISDWADLITVHSIAGEGFLDAIRSINNKPACFLIAQMSSNGSLISQEYTKRTVEIAEKYPDCAVGFITQNKISENPSMIHITPGVQFNDKSDNFGQKYITPEQAIKNGADVIVVGRGILKSINPKEEAQKYRNAAWDVYQNIQ